MAPTEAFVSATKSSLQLNRHKNNVKKKHRAALVFIVLGKSNLLLKDSKPLGA